MARSTALLLYGLLACMAPAFADDRLEVRGEVDLRAVASNASLSSLEGGLGRTRFDDDHEGLRLGRAFVDARLQLTETLQAHLVAGTYDNLDENPIDVTEAYLEYRPYPRGPIRWRLRGGAFYAPISMENRGPGWSNVYTISSSALNTWLGEEFRTVGLEGEARWLGATRGYAGDVAVIAGVYGWNDPAGVVLASRGWSLHDRQTALFGRLETPGSFDQHYRPGLHLFREIDGRPGYYAGLAWRHHNVLELRAIHYDNRADPAAFDELFAWLTKFNAVGARWEPNEHWTLITQAMRGVTYIGGDGAGFPLQGWRFNTEFLLGSFAWGPNRISARFDRFRMTQTMGLGGEEPYYDDRGHGYTLAYLRDFGDHWQLAAEWLRVSSEFEAREFAGLDPDIVETQAQLAIRYRFDWKH